MAQENAETYIKRGWPVLPLNGKLPRISKENGGNGKKVTLSHRSGFGAPDYDRVRCAPKP